MQKAKVRSALTMVCSIVLAVGAATWAFAQRAAPSVPPLDADVTPLNSENVAGHHLWIVVFDKGAMQPEDIERSAGDATAWLRQKQPNVDVVAVATIGSEGAEVLQDFTSNGAKLERAVAGFGGTQIDPAAAQAGGAAAPELLAQSDDVRLGGLKLICDTLRQWAAPKDLFYFTAGIDRAAENSLPYRDALTSCEKAKVTISSIDARGLIPGRGAGAVGRGGAGGGARGNAPGGDFNTLTPRGDRPEPETKASRPAFDGTWMCDRCPPEQLRVDPAWLGQVFTIVDPADGSAPSLVPQGPPRQLSLARRGETLVLTVQGAVQRDGRSVPVTVTHTFGAAKDGRLQVTTAITPAGLLSDFVSVYKRVQ